jgi:hypothetical protein
VALAAYAGASMAGADPFRIGNTAFRLGIGEALMPFVFVYGPAMLIVTTEFTTIDFLVTVFGCIAGIVLLSAAFTGSAVAAQGVGALDHRACGVADDRARSCQHPFPPRRGNPDCDPAVHDPQRAATRGGVTCALQDCVWPSLTGAWGTGI